ncbi:MAG: hypothetical protein FJ096_13650 [Deltaproteobacteria bacterium]|nr:hypothetical protein [Deltaproteobacteria bacterium]
MARPARVWLPGKLFVDDDGELVTGRGAGLLVEADGFPRQALGSVGKLVDLRHTMWLVERAKLDDTLVREFALVLPERLLDRDVQPFAHRWLAELPLVCFSGVKWDRIVRDERLGAYRVAIVERDARVFFELEVAGGKRRSLSLSVEVAALEAAARASEAPDMRSTIRETSIVDRLLREFTRGVLDEASVLAAFQAASLLEPGYGYRGALDGSPATIEQVQYGARALEAAFAAIEPRALTQRELAEAILESLVAPVLEGAPPPRVPTFGEAMRIVVPELRVSLASVGGSLREGSEAPDELVLPEVERWFVAEVEPWRPEIPPALAAQLQRVLKEREAPPEWLVLVAVGLLVLLALVSLLLRG